MQKEAKAAKDETESGALAGFLPAGSTRTSKVFQYVLVSESTQQVACLKCKKKLKGINQVIAFPICNYTIQFSIPTCKHF